VVFDIGAGDGRMRSPVEAAGGDYYGFDLAPVQTDITQWNLEIPLPTRHPRAGVALLLDVIEHCDNPLLALHHVAEALLPGGLLLLTTPNPRWSRSRFYALAKGTPSCFTQSDLESNHHVYPAWPHILQHQLGGVGLVTEEYVTLDGRTGWPRSPGTVRYPLRLLFAAAMKAVEAFDPSACGMSYAVVARKVV